MSDASETSRGPNESNSSQPTPANLLGVVGDLVEDIIIWSQCEFRPATDNPSHITRTRGGSAANVAALAASAGAPTRFIGRVGADAAGFELIETLAASGVDVRAQRAGHTGTVVVLVDRDGERTMFPDRGAAAELSDVPAAWLDALTMLHATSYSFAAEPAASATLDLMAAARATGIDLSLDASSTGLLADLGVARYVEIVAAVQPAIFFANASEAALLDLNRPPFSTMLTIIKDGSNPTTVHWADGGRSTVPVARVPTCSMRRAPETPSPPASSRHVSTDAGSSTRSRRGMPLRERCSAHRAPLSPTTKSINCSRFQPTTNCRNWSN